MASSAISSPPSPGFGTWRCDEALLEEAVLAALTLGYRHLDCAQLYKNERIVGRAIARAQAGGVLRSRAELFVTGKLAPTQMEPALVRPAIERSLADLFPEAAAAHAADPAATAAPYFDLFITHWPYAVDPACTTSPAPFAMRRGYSPAAYLAVWRAMEAAHDAGLVRSLGCSNMTAKKLHALIEGAEGGAEGVAAGAEGRARVRPACVQVEMHPFLQQRALLRFCAARGVAVTAYCPLGSPGRPALYRAPGDPDVLAAAPVLAAAARLARSPAQVLLRWAVQRGTVPLPRSTNAGRIAENLAGAHGAGGAGGDGGWALSDEDMAAIDELEGGAETPRIMKGDNFAREGEDWTAVWDIGWVEPAQ